MDYEKCSKTLNIIRTVFTRIVIALIIIALAFVASSAYDMFALTNEGRGNDEFQGFEELIKANPDAVAWIRLDGTHINHPVVQGEDNFEYLSKGFDGESYQGGAIFLDCRNAKDFSDEYIIIHGHHMSRGAMFSDVTSYLDEKNFEENRTGELLTPGGNYDLMVCGIKIVNAYEGELYYVGEEVTKPLRLMDDCMHKRDVEFKENDKLVLLSTCSGDMTNDRASPVLQSKKSGSEIMLFIHRKR